MVLRRMAFIGQGISHAGFGGVGTASLLGLGGVSQDVMVLVFCVGSWRGIPILSPSGPPLEEFRLEDGRCLCLLILGPSYDDLNESSMVLYLN